MLSQPHRALHDRAGKVDSGRRRAFPEWSLRRQLAVAENRDTEVRKVAQRRGEARRGDHVVGREPED